MLRMDTEKTKEERYTRVDQVIEEVKKYLKIL